MKNPISMPGIVVSAAAAVLVNRYYLKADGFMPVADLFVGILITYTIFMGLLLKKFKLGRYRNVAMESIDRMDGEEFEEWLACLFESKGYKVELTRKSHDYGADLIITKRGIRTAVQAKRYNSNVGCSAVQEIIGARAYYGADRCLVVTNSYFTKNAEVLAKANGVELWNREKLNEEITRRH